MRSEWVPLITLDLQEDISSLFIGPHVIKLSDISEFTSFPDWFAIFMAVGYILGKRRRQAVSVSLCYHPVCHLRLLTC